MSLALSIWRTTSYEHIRFVCALNVHVNLYLKVKKYFESRNSKLQGDASAPIASVRERLVSRNACSDTSEGASGISRKMVKKNDYRFSQYVLPLELG